MSGAAWHPVLGGVSYQVRGMSHNPDSQVRQTLGLMGRRVAEDSADPEIRFQSETGVRRADVSRDEGYGGGEGGDPWH